MFLIVRCVRALSGRYVLRMDSTSVLARRVLREWIGAELSVGKFAWLRGGRECQLLLPPPPTVQTVLRQKTTRHGESFNSRQITIAT
jgi:hypothetical protein